MKIDVDAYNEVKDRIRGSLILIEKELEGNFPEAHREVKSHIMELSSLIQEMNDGENGWDIRSMEDAFDG